MPDVSGLVKRIIDGVYSLLNPPFCAFCKTFDMQRGDVLCQTCDKKIFPIVSSTIQLTMQHQMKVFAVSRYQDPLKSLILAKTHSDIAVSKQLGKLLNQKLCIELMQPDFFVPIPLHWTRYAYRGYNQAEEMAAVLAQKNSIPLVHLLCRSKQTKFQAGLTSAVRKENLTDAFVVDHTMDRKQYQDKHLVLIDDLMTTGSTLKEAGRQLLTLKPRAINAIVVARVP